MKRKTLIALVALILLSFIVPAATANPVSAAAGKLTAPTAKAPALKLKNLQGRAFSLADYKGKVVLLNFWATWCPPCRAEIPDLIRLQDEYRDRGLQVIGITYPPERISEVRRFVRKLKVNYPVALGSKMTKLLFTQSDTLPMTVVIGRGGEILDMIEGVLLPEEFAEKIKPLLSARAGEAPFKKETSLRRWQHRRSANSIRSFLLNE